MDSTHPCCGYCWKREGSWQNVLCYKCNICLKKVHYDCVSWQPSPLLGDAFFNFKCQSCSPDGKEEFDRISLSWHNAVMLALYNLHKKSQGRSGYYHWKGHICAFIDYNWNTLFGPHRKKTNVWMGTVAGMLSTGCPEYFLSGSNLGLAGHWRLANLDPPLPTEKKKPHNRQKVSDRPVELNPDTRKCRRPGENTLAMAVELKEKRSSLEGKKKIPGKHKISPVENTSKETNTDSFANSLHVKNISDDKTAKKQRHKHFLQGDFGSHNLSHLTEVMEEPYLSDSQISGTSSEISFGASSLFSSSEKTSHKDEDVNLSERAPEDIWSMVDMETDDVSLDLELSLTTDTLDPRPQSPDFSTIVNTDPENFSFGMSGKSPVSNNKTSAVEVKQEVVSDTESDWPSEANIKEELSSSSEEEERTEQNSEEEDGEKLERQIQSSSWGLPQRLNEKRKRGRPSKISKLNQALQQTAPRLTRVSLFEEGEILQKLNDRAEKQKLPPELAQLRRKLICNQTNREFGLPVFDLENQMSKLTQLDRKTFASHPHKPSLPHHLPARVTEIKETRDLDRFMIHDTIRKAESRSYTSFHQRLVGFRDSELTPVISPYTTRVLLPFIWRNYDISHKPAKLKLLEEIQAYPHRKNPSWVQPKSAPLDFCYVRPEHVPSVNALCREFFWPGIDMSECLQYPDFSCIVLYKKIVVAFAFMVPDRGYNETYISFIFTHPEWRGAGIGTFMLYHLIQTCMGKDVLLHVSVTNPAMMLYQKFGFKCQELLLNFYYKYFPLNCKESQHAFLMRLSR